MTGFRQYLAAVASANRLGNDVTWLFYPGMLADSPFKWWGDFGRRPAAHEGIDICFYRTRNGPVRSLPAGTLVPAWSTGTVINVCEDFLGKTLVVAPEQFHSTGTRVLEVYSHLSVPGEFSPGTRVETGQIIANIADTHARGSVLCPHLHLSCLEVTAHVPAHRLDWSLFPRRDSVNVLHPVFMG